MAAALFSGQGVERYAEGPPRQVPGFHDLQRMVAMLLAESMPPDARVLVLGAGGGLELKAFAEAEPQWTFDGVDPSADMLTLARRVVGAHAARVRFHEGTIAAAPAGPFDGATSLLTFHFIAREARLATLRQVRERLRRGAPFVLAHISFAQHEPHRSRAIARHIGFGAAGAPDPSQIAAFARAIDDKVLTILPPEVEEDLLHAAGFAGVALFYAAFGFRGWVAYAD
ncbi:MAG: class I SAM-dependent methyltransferase [Acuticoccus sp.]